MFDFDAGKLMIIATVALVVIGPKDLPRVLRQLGQMVTRVRRMAGEFQSQFMDAMKEADIQELRDEVAKLKDSATLDVDFNPGKDIKAHLDDAMNMVGSSTLTPNFGSTSEMTPTRLPASSAIESSPSVAALPESNPSIGTLPLPEPIPDISMAEEVPDQAPRKSVVVRRRPGSRFDGAGGRTPGWQRSRNILPARRETSDQ